MTASCFRTAAARHGWPVLFLILNASGLALLLQEVRSLRRPPGRLAVVRLEPAGEATPEAVSEIAVEFGSALDPKTVKADAVRLTPPVAGAAILARERFLRFRLARPLRQATEYRVALAPDLRGRAGELPQACTTEDLAQALLAKGADVNAADTTGHTALGRAAYAPEEAY